MTRPALVIFDCDGVLVDSEPPTIRVMVESFARHGLTLTEEDCARLFVGGTMAGAGVTAQQMGADLPADWVVRIYEDIFAELKRGVPLIAGIMGVLDTLDAAGIPYCVGSNGSEPKMEVTLSQHPALYDRLRGRIFSAYTHGTSKPEPELFLIAARHYGIDPQDCAVIDDSPTGCIAARRAGMRGMGYAEFGDGARLAAEGAQVFHHMADLPGLLGL